MFQCSKPFAADLISRWPVQSSREMVDSALLQALQRVLNKIPILAGRLRRGEFVISFCSVRMTFAHQFFFLKGKRIKNHIRVETCYSVLLHVRHAVYVGQLLEDFGV